MQRQSSFGPRFIVIAVQICSAVKQQVNERAAYSPFGSAADCANGADSAPHSSKPLYSMSAHSRAIFHAVSVIQLRIEREPLPTEKMSATMGLTFLTSQCTIKAVFDCSSIFSISLFAAGNRALEMYSHCPSGGTGANISSRACISRLRRSVSVWPLFMYVFCITARTYECCAEPSNIS